MKKATHQTDRGNVKEFKQIENIGPSLAEKFHATGLRSLNDLCGKNPLKLYQKLCRTRKRHSQEVDKLRESALRKD